MATLTIPNVPPDLLARLRDRAGRENRSVEEAALSAIESWTAHPGDDATGPCNFPRPLEGVAVEARVGGERLPASSGLEYIPSPEISAPFDLEPSEPGVRVTPRDIPPPPLEFWFDEDKVAE